MAHSLYLQVFEKVFTQQNNRLSRVCTTQNDSLDFDIEATKVWIE